MNTASKILTIESRAIRLTCAVSTPLKQIYRCRRCGRRLADVSGESNPTGEARQIEIKCPRCKHLQTLEIL